MKTPAEFIALWRDSTLSERAGVQPFFLDLCKALGVAKPDDPGNYRQLDAAVAAAYGWDDYQPAMPDAEILRRLLALNRQLADRFAGGPED